MVSKIVSEDIINQALVTYIAKNTRYITQAEISRGEDCVRLDADFAIKESCYLYPYSGHFNAVEALICFNQMAYVALLGGIKEKMFDFYSNITPEYFNKNRRNVYILEFEKIKFKKQVNNNSFKGFLELKPLRKIGNKIYTDCRMGFGNDSNCNSFFGNIKIFIPVLDKMDE